MRIALISDSHGFLDDAVLAYAAECDEIWHAGDVGPAEVLDRLKAVKPLRGVSGNIDGADVRAELPEQSAWDCEGLRVYMRHIGGHPGRYDPRAKREILRWTPQLFICGHSHIARVDRDPALGLLHMNPGACGHTGWHAIRTMLRFSVNAGSIGRVELIELGPRGRSKRPAVG
jgi:putative phosphoesterase